MAVAQGSPAYQCLYNITGIQYLGADVSGLFLFAGAEQVKERLYDGGVYLGKITREGGVFADISLIVYQENSIGNQVA